MNGLPLQRGALALAGFAVLAGGFCLLIGRGPLDMLQAIAQAAAGSSFAMGESLLRATPILLCALATLVPARLGLVSVGAEGQLYFGALVGTGAMLLAPAAPFQLPLVLLGGMLGGALWALLPALLRIAAGANETISTLMLNYVASLLVTWLVYGPWKNPQSQGWPASIDFPGAARLPLLGDSRMHVGLLVALGVGIVLHVLLTRSRWGLVLDVLRSNPRLAPLAGLNVARQVLLTMAIGGTLAGLAGIAETASVQGRLQSAFANGAGLSGFLVAWLAGNRVLPTMALALLVGGLLAAGDGLQMMTSVPSSAVLVVQGLMFVALLGAGGWRGKAARG